MKKRFLIRKMNDRGENTMNKNILILSIILCSSVILTGCSREEEVVREPEVWEQKIIPTEELRVGVITDTQVHPSRINKYRKGPDVERYLKPRYGDAVDAFVEEMMIFQPDVIVVPGDIIEGTGDEALVGIAGLKIVQEKLSELDVPIIWAVGNHELRALTKAQYMEALGIDYLNESFEFGDYRFIVLDGNFYPDDSDIVPGGERYIRGHVAQSGIDYLKQELQTDKQTVLFIHQPPFVGADITDRASEGLLDNGNRIQELLTIYNASTAIGGHIEYKRHIQKEGVDYYALPGTIKSLAFPGAYYSVIFSQGSPDVTMYYVDPDVGEYIHVDFEETEDKSGKKVDSEIW